MIDVGPATAATPLAPQRDRRLDLLRGAALVSVWIDHFEDVLRVSDLSRLTLRAWGPSDAAELFVLLSGLTVGRTYACRIDRDGLLATGWHAISRTVWLYVACCLTGVGLLLAAMVLPSGSDPRLFPVSMGTSDWGTAASQMLLLETAPTPLQILFLYLVWLPLSPGLVRCLQRWPRATLLSAFATSLAVQPLWRTIPLQTNSFAGWYFQPLGWQALYVVGLAVGLRWQGTGRLHSTALGKPSGGWPAAIGLAAAVIIIGGWFLRPEITGSRGVAGGLFSGDFRKVVVSMLSKSTLGPLRMLHGLAVAWWLFRLLPADWAREVPRPLQPIARCGRYSLLCYTAGVLLLVPGVAVARLYGSTRIVVLLVEFDALLLTCLTAYAWSGIAWSTGRACDQELPPPGGRSSTVTTT